jgi:hypothetical protein
VLLALGVVKVATAAQLRQLVLPGTADVQTVRNACKDLRDAGLLESVGKVTGTNPSGRPVSEQLWNLTTAGLAAAATELDRPLAEMGGTAREAARAGATHAVKVTDTIDAFLQTPPQPTKPWPATAHRPPPGRQGHCLPGPQGWAHFTAGTPRSLSPSPARSPRRARAACALTRS